MPPVSGAGGIGAGGAGSDGEDPGVHFGGEGPGGDPGQADGGADDAPGAGDGDDKNAVEVESGCACRAPAHRDRGGAALFALLGAGALALRRRRQSQ